VGYKRSKIFRLVFADEEFEGLEIRAKSVPVGEFLKITELMELDDSADFGVEDMEKITDLFQSFATALVSWNLEDDNDKPIPATLEGLHSQDLDFVLEIIKAWMSAVSSVPKSLGKDSVSGVTFPEASLQMDPLSDARLALSGQS
jgi:hypothetical protein